MEQFFTNITHKSIRTLKPYQPGKPIEELQRELGLSSIIKLASNENAFGASLNVQQAIKDAVPGCARYPDSNGFLLKAALSKHYSIDPAQITLGNGSDSLFQLIAQAFAGTGYNIISSQYAFVSYLISAHTVQAEYRAIPALNWGFNLPGILAAIDNHTRVIFIANPNNPTGTWLTHNDIKTFLQQVPPQVLVVLDEAYAEYITEPNYPNCLPLLAQFKNLIVTRTFSKIYGLAGLRVGYAIADPEITDILNRIRPPFNVNSLAQIAATAALHDQAHVARCRELTTAGRVQLMQQLQEMSIDSLPSPANFFCIDLKRPAHDVFQALLQRGVIVRPIANYGMDHHLRITIGTEQENSRFIQALKEG
jgi:histidinol-phosphate aminotransferase